MPNKKMQPSIFNEQSYFLIHKQFSFKLEIQIRDKQRSKVITQKGLRFHNQVDINSILTDKYALFMVSTVSYIQYHKFFMIGLSPYITQHFNTSPLWSVCPSSFPERRMKPQETGGKNLKRINKKKNAREDKFNNRFWVASYFNSFHTQTNQK